MAKHLRPVSEGERLPEPLVHRVLSVTKAAEEGTPRELLMAMRKRVAGEVENPNTPARDLAALTRRLMEIQASIEAIDAREAEEAEGAGAAAADEEWEAI